MKKGKLMIAFMVMIISFCFQMAFIDASQRVKLNYKYDYGLSSNYFSFTIEEDKQEDTLNKLYELCSKEKITILFENHFDNILGVYDTLNKYTNDELFLGSYFTKQDFQNKNKKALKLVNTEANKIIDNVIINEYSFDLIGEYTEDYILYNDVNLTIYPLFTLQDIKGTYYIDGDADVKTEIIKLFERDGYTLNVEYAKINVLEMISYIAQDQQFKMIFFVLILAIISLVVTDYAIMRRNYKKYYVHYLVGSNQKTMFVHELIKQSMYYIVSISLAVVGYFGVLGLYSHTIEMPFFIILLNSIIMFIIFILIHMILYAFLQNKSKGVRR